MSESGTMCSDDSREDQNLSWRDVEIKPEPVCYVYDLDLVQAPEAAGSEEEASECEEGAAECEEEAAECEEEAATETESYESCGAEAELTHDYTPTLGGPPPLIAVSHVAQIIPPSVPNILFLPAPPTLMYIGPKRSSSDTTPSPPLVTQEREDPVLYERTGPGYINLPFTDDGGRVSDYVTLDTLRQQDGSSRRSRNQTGRYIGNRVDDPIDDAAEDDAAESQSSNDPAYSTETESPSESSEFSDSDDIPLQKRVKLKNNSRETSSTPSQKTINDLVVCLSCPDPAIVSYDSQPKTSSFKCEKCARSFLCEYHLNLHRTIHLFKFECKKCHRRFPSAINADIHYRYSHKSSKKLNCSMCGLKNVNSTGNSNDGMFHFITCSQKNKHKLPFIEVSDE